jgi:hypothetical protein
MKLYKIEASNMEAFFGTPKEYLLLLKEKDVVIIAQTPSCDAFLFLAKNTFDEDEPELLDSVPAGFDFTYCQEWGLTVDDDVVDRVILDLRKKAYPSWQDQLDDIYHNGIEGWKADTITPIKEKYPKENS